MSHGARQHAKYSGSIAHRFPHCPGSVRLCSTLPPRPDSEESEEGTKAHELLELSLHEGMARIRGAANADPEMVAAIEHVHDFLERLTIQHGKLYVKAEPWLFFPQNVVPTTEAACYPDLVITDHEWNWWFVDFKFGHVFVSEKRNAQLLFGAASALLAQQESCVKINSVNCVIIQPRVTWAHGGTTRTWSCTAADLFDFRVDIERAIVECEKPDAPLVPGEWCRFCPAEDTCPARTNKSLSVMQAPPPEQLHAWSPPSPDAMTLEQRALISAHADEIRAWLKAVEDGLQREAMVNPNVPGHKLVEVRGKRQLPKLPAAVVAKQLADQFPGMTAEQFMDLEINGISEIERKVIAHVRRNAAPGMADMAAQDAKTKLAFFAAREGSGRLELVPLSDPRPAVQRAAMQFGTVAIPPLP